MISMLEAPPKQCHRQCSKHSPEQCKLSNARTYVRTDKELTHLGSYLTLGNARRGGTRFHPIRVENSPPASAARGQIGAVHA